MGSACADVLTGSGESFRPPGRDIPALTGRYPLCEYFAGEGKDVEYRESYLVGYRITTGLKNR